MAARDSLIDTIKTRVVQGGSSGRRHTPAHARYPEARAVSQTGDRM